MFNYTVASYELISLGNIWVVKYKRVTRATRDCNVHVQQTVILISKAMGNNRVSLYVDRV